MQIHFNNINRSLDFLQEALKRRLEDHFNKQEGKEFDFPEITIEHEDVPLNHFLIKHQLNIEEYTILMLALIPNIQPNFLDSIIQQ
ncbi:MAG: hypothetical protein ABIS01_08820 [Ferruginibacter sp.]